MSRSAVPLHWLLAVVLAGAIIVGLTAGCTSGNEDGVNSGPTPVVGAPKGGEAGEIVLPVDAYSPPTNEMSKAAYARLLLMGACMRRSGYTFDQAAARAEADRTEQVMVLDTGQFGNKRRYGLTDMAIAKQYGFHLISVAKGLNAQPDSNGPRKLHGLVYPDAGDALTAFRTTLQACLTEADGQIGPAGNTPESIAAKIAGDSYERSLSDPKVVAAFAAWSTCVKAKGYNWDTPRVEGTGFDIDALTVSQKEITAAEASVACKVQHKVIETWFAFEMAYQEAQIELRFQELQEAKKAIADRLKKIDDIIATNS